MARYVIRGGREGYERLLLLAESHRSSSVELLRRVGVQPGMRCLDLGCGTGAVAFELASLTGPAGEVVGLDMDQVKLDLASEVAAERGLANVEFRRGDINTWDEPDGYDIVYSRFVVQHLGQPVDLLRRMWRAVRRGGSLVVEDADFDGAFCDPPNAAFDFFLQVFAEVMRRNGGDHATGRKLYRYFREAGIPQPELTLVQGVTATGRRKVLMLSTLEAIAGAVVDAGLATEAELAAAIADLTAFTDDDATLIAEPRVFQLFARR